MIDLTKKGLPNAIVLNGKSFSIKTDFREWIRYEQLSKTQGTKLTAYLYLFDKPMTLDLSTEELCREYEIKLLEFYQNPNSTPKRSNAPEEVISDYSHDGEFIYSGFMKTYGIDLSEVEMHWHKFKALLNDLNSDCLYKSILSFRSYEKSNKEVHQAMLDLKHEWELPDDIRITQEENNALLEFQKKHGIS